MTINQHLLPVKQGSLPLTLATNKGGGASVVIMPSAFGVCDDLKLQMEELAEKASLVVALDPFFRGDAGIVPYEDMARVMKRLQALDRQLCYRDLCTALRWTRQETKQPVVLLGICFGGPFAMLAAQDNLVDGVVTWHGTQMQNYLEHAAQIRCPLRLHFGGADPFVPLSAVEEIRAALSSHPDVRLFVHEGATHGFSHRAAQKAYQPQAEQAGMASVFSLLETMTKPLA